MMDTDLLTTFLPSTSESHSSSLVRTSSILSSSGALVSSKMSRIEATASLLFVPPTRFAAGVLLLLLLPLLPLMRSCPSPWPRALFLPCSSSSSSSSSSSPSSWLSDADSVDESELGFCGLYADEGVGRR